MSYKVGQEVYLRDVNESRQHWKDGKPPTVTIEKVGRKLVHVEWCGRTKSFLLNSGIADDAYGHQHLQSFEEFERYETRGVIRGRLKELGIEPTGYGDYKYDNDTLEKVIEILEETE